MIKWKVYPYFCIIVVTFLFSLGFEANGAEIFQNPSREGTEGSCAVVEVANSSDSEDSDTPPLKPVAYEADSDKSFPNLEVEDANSALEEWEKHNAITELTRDEKFGIALEYAFTGSVAAAAGALSALPFTTLLSVGFDFVGMPLPTEGIAHYVYMTILGTPPCVAVARAAYFGANWLYDKVASQCSQRKEEVNRADEARVAHQAPAGSSPCIGWCEELKRIWFSCAWKPKIYSYPTETIETAFWCGLYFSFIKKAEEEIYRDDPRQGQIYGWAFGGVSIPFSWEVFVHSNNDPNEHPFRQLKKAQDRKYVDKLSMVQEIVREVRSFCYCGGLPSEVNVLEEKWDAYSSSIILESKLEEIIKKYKEESYFNSYYESWQHRRMVLSSWVSLVWSGGAYLIKPLIAYFLLHEFFADCNVTGDALFGTSVGLDVPVSLFLLFGSLKRQSSLQQECSRLLEFFYKMDTPASWGAALWARWCGLSTIGIPTTYYLKREVLDYWKDNSGLQDAFVVLFVAEAVAAANLFYEKHFVGIANWFEEGAPVFNRCTGKKIKLLPWWPNQATLVSLMKKVGLSKRVLDVSHQDDDLQFRGNERLNWRGGEAAHLMASFDTL